jgi:hypothetical protein
VPAELPRNPKAQREETAQLPKYVAKANAGSFRQLFGLWGLVRHGVSSHRCWRTFMMLRLRLARAKRRLEARQVKAFAPKHVAATPIRPQCF